MEDFWQVDEGQHSSGTFEPPTLGLGVQTDTHPSREGISLITGMKDKWLPVVPINIPKCSFRITSTCHTFQNSC